MIGLQFANQSVPVHERDHGEVLVHHHGDPVQRRSGIGPGKHILHVGRMQGNREGPASMFLLASPDAVLDQRPAPARQFPLPTCYAGSGQSETPRRNG